MTRHQLRALAGRVGRGAALRSYRVDRGLSVLRVATEIHCPPAALHQAEDGTGDDAVINRAAMWIAAYRGE